MNNCIMGIISVNVPKTWINIFRIIFNLYCPFLYSYKWNKNVNNISILPTFFLVIYEKISYLFIHLL